VRRIAAPALLAYPEEVPVSAVVAVFASGELYVDGELDPIERLGVAVAVGDPLPHVVPEVPREVLLNKPVLVRRPRAVRHVLECPLRVRRVERGAVAKRRLPQLELVLARDPRNKRAAHLEEFAPAEIRRFRPRNREDVHRVPVPVPPDPGLADGGRGVTGQRGQTEHLADSRIRVIGPSLAPLRNEGR
jgi:hypothetical protein